MLFALIGFVSAEAFTPEEGTFAFREVENYTLHDINFTVPTEYRLQGSGNDFLDFKHGKDKLKITVVKDGKVEKVKSTKKIKSGKTMLGSQKGYLVDKKGSYTFSYYEGDYLVTIKSKDMSLMIGVMGKD
ncbi:hypothetical protein [Methanobrevibacter sp.]|uniref:hypothetical protein n=1 Tax=Methanobrevibacter sp. TaxID=66852 RepID=UPI00388FB311